MSTFFGGNKKTNHKLSKAFYFIKISFVKAEFIEFFWQKRVISTAAETTTAANQMYFLGIKQ